MERSNIGALLAQKQTGFGTYPTLTAANAFPLIDNRLDYSLEGQNVDRRAGHKPARFSKADGFIALPAARMRFETELAGNGSSNAASGQAPRLSDLFLACDLAETATPSSDVSYKLTVPTDEGTYLYLEWYSEKKKHILRNAKGNLQLQLEDGQIPKLVWEFLGDYVAIADASMPTGFGTWGIANPPSWVNAAVTLGSYTPIITSATFDLGNQLAIRRDVTQANGTRGAIITDRNPTGGIDPEAVAEATQPFFADWYGGQNRTLTVPIGATAGNKFEAVATVRPTELGYTDRDNIRAHQLGFSIEQAAVTADTVEFILKYF